MKCEHTATDEHGVKMTCSQPATVYTVTEGFAGLQSWRAYHYYCAPHGPLHGVVQPTPVPPPA